ncbi:MAG: cytochrome c3 family protein [Candidatus Methylomirabilales bacterium]
MKPASCRGCHDLPTSGAPMAFLDCKQCHLKEQQVKPLADCKGCHAALGGLHTAGMHPSAGCTACHSPHTWLPAPRQTCLTCHTDKARHFPDQPCAQCHSFRAVAKSAAAPAPPPVTFTGAAGSPGPVTFAHQIHLARGPTCSNCHPTLFKMQPGGLSLTMDKMAAGKFCGACHNGKKAFSVMNGDKCFTGHKS